MPRSVSIAQALLNKALKKEEKVVKKPSPKKPVRIVQQPPKKNVDMGALLGYGSDEENEEEEDGDAVDDFLAEINELEKKQAVEVGSEDDDVIELEAPKEKSPSPAPSPKSAASDEKTEEFSKPPETSAAPPGLLIIEEETETLSAAAPPGLDAEEEALPSAPPGLPSAPPGLPSGPPGLSSDAGPPGLIGDAPPGLSDGPPGLAPTMAGPPGLEPEDPEELKKQEQLAAEADEFLKEVESLDKTLPTDQEVKEKQTTTLTLAAIDDITARAEELLKSKDNKDVTKSASASPVRSKKKKEKKRSSSKAKERKKKRKRKRSDSAEKSSKKRKTEDRPIWRECIDDETKKPYYWNTKTGQTTWHKPDEPFEEHKKKSKDSSSSRKSKREKEKKKKSRKRRSRSGSYTRRRSRDREYERERRDKRSRSRDRRRRKRSKSKSQTRSKPEEEKKTDKTSIKKTKTYAKNIHLGLKSRIDYLMNEIKDAEGLKELNVLSISLAVRHEDWAASALENEYFCKKIQEIGSKVSALSKKYTEASKPLSSKTLEEEIDEEEKQKKKEEEERKKNENNKQAENVLNNEENVISKTMDVDVDGNTDKDLIDLTGTDVTMEIENVANVGEEPMEVEPVVEEVEEMIIPFSFIRRYDVATQSHYYEDSKTKETTWDLPDDQKDWVDLTQVLVKRDSEDVFKTVDVVTNCFATADVTISSSRKHLDKFLLSFSCEEDAWSALFFLEIEHSTPEKTYTNSDKWLKTRFEFHVRFLNNKDTAEENESSATNQLYDLPATSSSAGVEDEKKTSTKDGDSKVVTGLPSINKNKKTAQASKKVAAVVKPKIKKKKRKKQKFGKNKKFAQLANKWAQAEKQRDKEAEKKTPAYRAKMERLKNEQWVKEQSGNTAEDNPNLIEVADWRANLGLKKKKN